MNTFEAKKMLTPFCGVPFPKAEELFYTKNNISDYEGNRIFEFFNGRSWDSISAAEIVSAFKGRSIRSIPAFMTNRGFSYYLPTLLSACLDATEDVDELFDALCNYCLSKPAGAGRTILSDYSHEQWAAVKEAFHECQNVRSNEKAIHAIARFAERSS